MVSNKKVVEGGPVWVTDFDEKSVIEVSKAIIQLAEEDPSQPIQINVDSYGGSVHGLNGILATMDSVPNTLVTVAMGKAMSAGAVLLSHGDVRCASPHARIMIHEITAGTDGNINDLKLSVDELHLLNAQLLQVLAQNCGKSVKALKKLYTNEKRDIFMSANDAKAFGLIDHVGVPQIIRQSAFALDFTVSANKAAAKLNGKKVKKK